MKYTPNKATIIRTIVYIVALVNMALTVLGKNPIPYPTEEIENAFAIVFDVIAGLIGFWKNNSFTQSAIATDAIMRAHKYIAKYSDEGGLETAIELTNGGDLDE